MLNFACSYRESAKEQTLATLQHQVMSTTGTRPSCKYHIQSKVSSQHFLCTISTTANKNWEFMKTKNTLSLSRRFSRTTDFKALLRHSTSLSASAFVGYLHQLLLAPIHRSTWQRCLPPAMYCLFCKRE